MLLTAPPHHSHQIIRLFSQEDQASCRCRFFLSFSPLLSRRYGSFLLDCSRPLVHPLLPLPPHLSSCYLLLSRLSI
ncbi:hypothetical protein CCMA1212_004881 [Trichoderma ghanense]|uniref:Uncharacterized protein n=1 Tax=Trichoderma ghanense TaxID=65468 RepID=A0ABY2H5Y5_9HYPO